MNDATTGSQHVIVRRYAYSAEEFVSFAVAGLITGGSVYRLGLPFMIPLAVATTVLSVSSCVYLSWSRKERSKVTVTLTAGRYLNVHSEGVVGMGSVDLDKVRSVTFREIGANKCFVLHEPAGHNSAGPVVNLPVCVLDDPTLYKIVGAKIAVHQPSKSVCTGYDALPKPVLV